MSRLSTTEIPEYIKLAFVYNSHRYEFDCPVLMSLYRKKNIVKTQIYGRDSSIKEYIGSDDFAITISGIIDAENGQSPVTQVNALKYFLELKEPIEVVCPWLNTLSVFSIVIEDYTLPQKPGGYSSQDFTINAISDDPLELQIR